MRWTLLILLIVSALEIGVFVWAGGIIGPWWVVFLIILTGVIGITLAKQQGIETWHRAMGSLHYGQIPGEEILDGVCILIGAIFLLTPGFITDITGFLLVLPWSRQLFKRQLKKVIRKLFDKNIFIFRKWD